MSDMLPPPVRGVRATVSTPSLTAVEREAAAFAQTRGAVAPPQDASPAPAPMPEPAAAPPPRLPRQIPRAFAGIDFTAAAVVSDTGETYPIHPDDMPKLLDFAFRVAIQTLQNEVDALRESLGIPEPGGNSGPAQGEGVQEVQADETPGEVQGG